MLQRILNIDQGTHTLVQKMSVISEQLKVVNDTSQASGAALEALRHDLGSTLIGMQCHIAIQS